MKTGVIVAFVLVVLIAGGFYFYNQTSGNASTSNKVINSATGNAISSDVRVIEVNATSFSYSPEVIKVKKGEKVKIIVNNEDKTHGIAIKEFGVSGIGSVEFTADKTGTFEFHCPTFCGPGHREMTGTLIVE